MQLKCVFHPSFNRREMNFMQCEKALIWMMSLLDLTISYESIMDRALYARQEIPISTRTNRIAVFNMSARFSLAQNIETSRVWSIDGPQLQMMVDSFALWKVSSYSYSLFQAGYRFALVLRFYGIVFRMLFPRMTPYNLVGGHRGFG